MAQPKGSWYGLSQMTMSIIGLRGAIRRNSRLLVRRFTQLLDAWQQKYGLRLHFQWDLDVDRCGGQGFVTHQFLDDE